jgi:hypothetical protein
MKGFGQKGKNRHMSYNIPYWHERRHNVVVQVVKRNACADNMRKA